MNEREADLALSLLYREFNTECLLLPGFDQTLATICWQSASMMRTDDFMLTTTTSTVQSPRMDPYIITTIVEIFHV